MRRMFFVLLFLPMFVWGQNFSFTTDHQIVSGEPNEELVIDFSIKNLSDSEVSINIVRSNVNLPEGWSSSLCFDFCFRNDIDSIATSADFGSTPLSAGESREFSFHFFTNENGEAGTATVTACDLNNPSEKYSFELTGNTNATGIKDEIILDKFFLDQNYPNPFNPTTEIQFGLREADKVNIKVFDAIGREITVLTDRFYSPGNHKITFDATNLTSGIYLYRMETTNFVETKKMILEK